MGRKCSEQPRGRYQFAFTVPGMYPHEAPKVKSETKIYHPNIDLQGNVTLALQSSAHRRVTQFFLQCFVEKERYFSSKLFFSHYIYIVLGDVCPGGWSRSLRLPLKSEQLFVAEKGVNEVQSFQRGSAAADNRRNIDRAEIAYFCRSA